MPLKISVIGGGIAGLATAALLRKNGHKITIYETSSFSHEVGAAITIAPNCVRIIRQGGFDERLLRATDILALRLHVDDGNRFVYIIDGAKHQERLGVEPAWLATHRADIHDCMRDAVTTIETGSEPVDIRLKSRITSVDSKTGAVTLEDGSVETADLVVGGDGIHSVALNEILGGEHELIDTDQNCYRFLVPVSKVLNNPKTRTYMTKIGINTVDVVVDEQTTSKMVIYPCRDSTLLNIAIIHPANWGQGTVKSGWLAEGDFDGLMRVASRLNPEAQELCKLAEDVRLWSLATKDPPPTFSRDKLVLVGDAAHHYMPHQGQGAAMGIEDAACLSIVLDRTVTPENLQQRLQLYNDIRYPRTVMLSLLSRVDDQKKESMMPMVLKYVPDAVCPKDIIEWMWPYDVAKDTERRLDQLKEAAIEKSGKL